MVLVQATCLMWLPLGWPSASEGDLAELIINVNAFLIPTRYTVPFLIGYTINSVDILSLSVLNVITKTQKILLAKFQPKWPVSTETSHVLIVHSVCANPDALCNNSARPIWNLWLRSQGIWFPTLGLPWANIIEIMLFYYFNHLHRKTLSAFF